MNGLEDNHYEQEAAGQGLFEICRMILITYGAYYHPTCKVNLLPLVNASFAMIVQTLSKRFYSKTGKYIYQYDTLSRMKRKKEIERRQNRLLKLPVIYFYNTRRIETPSSSDDESSASNAWF